MGEISEIAAAMLQMSERRLEVVSQNVSNAQTPGYKSVDAFQLALEAKLGAVDGVFDPASRSEALLQLERLARQGKLEATDSPFDFAISGEGAFAVRDPVSDTVELTRNGKFQSDMDGFIVDARGWRLQNVDGQDMRASSDAIVVQQDGLMLENDRPVDKVGVYEMGGTGLTNMSTEVFELRQGMVETSNVSLPDEMIAMMEAIRQAETGSRVMQTYDTLMGQAISAFGQ